MRAQKRPKARLPMFSKLNNYTSTYRVLLKSYFAWKPREAVLSALAVVLTAVLLPVPFFLLARAPMAASSEAGLVSLPMGLKLTLPETLIIALASFLVIATLQYLVDRWVLAINRGWQDHLFRQAVRSLPRFARVDRTIALPLPLTLTSMMRLISQGTRTTYLIARLISVGLKDVAIVVVTLGMLAVLDFYNLLMIIGVSLAFLPLYLAAGTEMVKLRRGREETLPQARREALEIIEEAAGIRPDGFGKIDAVVGRFDDVGIGQLHDLPNRQMAVLVKLRLVAVLHAVAVAFTVLYLSSGFGQSFTAADATYLVILLIFLKSLLGIAALLSRFTRGYTGMAVLRQIIEPKRKSRLDEDPGVGAVAQPRRDLLVGRRRGGSVALDTDRPTFLLMPRAEYAFELVALSNGIRPTGRSHGVGDGWIGLSPSDWPADGALDGHLAEKDCVGIVVEQEEWAGKSGKLGAAPSASPNEGPIVFFRVGPESVIEFPESAQMIVCDKQSVLDVGDAKVMFARYREIIAKADVQAKQRVFEDDDDEDM